MRWLGAVYAYVLSHTRVQFHPAAYAILFAVTMIVLMTAALAVLSLIFQAFGSTGVAVDYETNAAIFGPVLFGELVRGHVKAWLRYLPEEYCFPAIGIAGFAAGGVFGAAMTLQWGRPLWLELFGWGLGVAALYLIIGWMIRLDEKKRLRSIR